MNRPNVKWKAVQKPSNPGSFVEYEGYDEDGNYYYETANREVVVCVLKDGRKGAGWTAEEAFKEALMRVPKKEKKRSEMELGNFVKVKQMWTPNGSLAKNQFEITTDRGIVFQSYNTIIAFITNDGKVYLDNLWRSSTTTGKYRNMFLRETQKDTMRKVKSGEYKVIDLNQ